MMFVSQLPLSSSSRVQLPTEGCALFLNVYSKTSFIMEFGNVEVVWNEEIRTWEVPSFTESRQRFQAGKLQYCKTFGSE